MSLMLKSEMELKNEVEEDLEAEHQRGSEGGGILKCPSTGSPTMKSEREMKKEAEEDLGGKHLQEPEGEGILTRGSRSPAVTPEVTLKTEPEEPWVGDLRGIPECSGVGEWTWKAMKQESGEETGSEEEADSGRLQQSKMLSWKVTGNILQSSNIMEKHTIQAKREESEAEEEGDSPTGSLAESSSASYERKTYRCLECGKTFLQKSCLKRHHMIHTGERPFTCAECGKSFNQKIGLIRHQTSHTGEKPFECSECGKSFTRKITLTIHKRTHAGPSPFTCEESGKNFTVEAHLKTHQVDHTGVRPYMCTGCGKSFSHKDSLTYHEKIHTGEELFPCSECGKSFPNKIAMTVHERTHISPPPLTCEECRKHFTIKVHLKMHQASHSGMRPYRCTNCGKSFHHKHSLTYQEKIHSKEQPFSCHECGKNFSIESHLLVHQKVHRKADQKSSRRKRDIVWCSIYAEKKAAKNKLGMQRENDLFECVFRERHPDISHFTRKQIISLRWYVLKSGAFSPSERLEIEQEVLKYIAEEGDTPQIPALNPRFLLLYCRPPLKGVP